MVYRRAVGNDHVEIPGVKSKIYQNFNMIDLEMFLKPFKMGNLFTVPYRYSETVLFEYTIDKTDPF